MIDVQTFSYHCHTNFSDGKDTLLDMVMRAKEIGFTELGISDHLIVHKDFAVSKSWPFIRLRSCPHIYNNDFKRILPSYQKHCEAIRRCAKELNFKLYVGFEVDYFTYDGWLDELKEFLKQLDYDYLISGNHMLFAENGRDVFEINDLPEICSDISLCHKYLQRHFTTINESIKSGLFKFVAHIDYARKLGDKYCGKNSFEKEKQEIINSLEKYGVGTELSTKGLRKIGDFYPCDWLRKEISQKNITVVISDDAHKISEVGKDFAKAEETLKKYGMVNRLHF